MKLKKHCNCPNADITEQGYEDLLFEAIQTTNKYKADRAVVIKGDIVTHVSINLLSEIQYKVLAYVRVGSKTFSDIETIEHPYGKTYPQPKKKKK